MPSQCFERQSDLPPEVPAKKRSKVHLAVYMTKLLNFMYLALKHKKDEARRFESFESMIKNKSFVESVLNVASEDLETDESATYYQSKFLSLEDRKYSNILLWLENVWELALSKGGAIYSIFGFSRYFDDHYVLIRAGVQHTGRPFRVRLPNFRAMFLEASRGPSGTLTKSTLYIGNSIIEPSLTIDIALRLPIRSEDLITAFNYQISYRKYYLLNNNFEIYPFLLRARRISYGRMREGGKLDDLLTFLLASRFADSKCIESIVHGEYPLNVLLMMPLIYLNGALSLLVAFEGESEEMLASGSRVRIQLTDDTYITAFRAGTSVLDMPMIPGRYLYLAALPITYPKLAAVLGAFNPEISKEFPKVESAFKSRTRKRNLREFPTLNEILSRW